MIDPEGNEIEDALYGKRTPQAHDIDALTDLLKVALGLKIETATEIVEQAMPVVRAYCGQFRSVDMTTA